MDGAIRTTLSTRPEIGRARGVAAFLAFDGEPDLAPLLSDLHARGITVCLPVLETNGERHLVMREWHPELELTRGDFGIREPTTGQARSLEEVDVVLVPLVAWDRQGFRLGMGAGYYDRLFAAHRHRPTPLRIGIAYAVQEAGAVPVEPWDIPLHAVVTERGWFTCPA